MFSLRRRWFSYSLRTLFVLLTAFGIWLGLKVKWVSDRRAARAWIVEHPADDSWVLFRTDADEFFASRAGGTSSRRALRRKPLPWMLRMLGERPVSSVFVKIGPDEVSYDKKILRELFPEAIVDVQRHEGGLFKNLAECLRAPRE